MDNGNWDPFLLILSYMDAVTVLIGNKQLNQKLVSVAFSATFILKQKTIKDQMFSELIFKAGS